MRYAIIAAGEGSRLAHEGVSTPKPLVTVGGEPLIDRLVNLFVAHQATEVVVVCRPDGQAGPHLAALQRRLNVPLRFMERTTPSSMHSLFELSPWLADDPFVLTTVDTVFRSEEFGAYVAQFQQLLSDGSADGLMGVTTYIDDEKPLHVVTDGHLRITAFADAVTRPHYISGGIYGLTPPALATLRACIQRGEQRMRNFQRALLADGLRLRAFPFGTVFDIDHATDVVKAEHFIR